ncbi:hypothetical protein ACFVTP_10570 [Streptomyces celluloflavus]|uniref:hypothetical protein n=1 Tax=Streptomyces celluloflavus TaxID=58344 RepID=UPI0036DD48E8
MPDEPDDYFGRLLARHAPAPPDGLSGAAGGRRALVRPRLPGPFERVTALPGPAVPPDGPEPPYPGAAARTSPPAGPQVRYEREVRTSERETVLRGEAPARDEPDFLSPQPPHVEPLLTPAVLPVAGTRPAARGAVRPPRRTRPADEDGPAPTAASAPVRPGPDAGPRAVTPALRPRTDGAPAARGAARTAAAGRRGQRPAERVVHIQIGRLEVSAAGPERPAAGGRPSRTERRGPSLSLAEYLSRDEKRN